MKNQKNKILIFSNEPSHFKFVTRKQKTVNNKEVLNLDFVITRMLTF